jgi:hypothetical protein
MKLPADDRPGTITLLISWFLDSSKKKVETLTLLKFLAPYQVLVPRTRKANTPARQEFEDCPAQVIDARIKVNSVLDPCVLEPLLNIR